MIASNASGKHVSLPAGKVVKLFLGDHDKPLYCTKVSQHGTADLSGLQFTVNKSLTSGSIAILTSAGSPKIKAQCWIRLTATWIQRGKSGGGY